MCQHAERKRRGSNRHRLLATGRRPGSCISHYHVSVAGLRVPGWSAFSRIATTECEVVATSLSVVESAVIQIAHALIPHGEIDGQVHGQHVIRGGLNTATPSLGAVLCHSELPLSLAQTGIRPTQLLISGYSRGRGTFLRSPFLKDMQNAVTADLNRYSLVRFHVEIPCRETKVVDTICIP